MRTIRLLAVAGALAAGLALPGPARAAGHGLFGEAFGDAGPWLGGSAGPGIAAPVLMPRPFASPLYATSRHGPCSAQAGPADRSPSRPLQCWGHLCYEPGDTFDHTGGATSG